MPEALDLNGESIRNSNKKMPIFLNISSFFVLNLALIVGGAEVIFFQEIIILGSKIHHPVV